MIKFISHVKLASKSIASCLDFFGSASSAPAGGRAYYTPLSVRGDRSSHSHIFPDNFRTRSNFDILWSASYCPHIFTIETLSNRFFLLRIWRRRAEIGQKAAFLLVFSILHSSLLSEFYREDGQGLTLVSYSFSYVLSSGLIGFVQKKFFRSTRRENSSFSAFATLKIDIFSNFKAKRLTRENRDCFQSICLPISH